MHPDVLRYSSPGSPSIGQLKDAIVCSDDGVQDIADQMSNLGIQAVCEKDSNFPSKLCRIKSQPYILYYQGDISLLEKPMLGVVGPRQPSIYAGKVLDRLFKAAEHYNMVTISGMASGVDQIAHRLSIQKSIPTIAVLGGGLGWYLQRPERHLIASIVEHGGLVISEFRLFQKPETYTFPQRNRIIAGLSDMLFLPEAGKKSGSLITVDFAHQMGIPVYGTPYDIFCVQSEGLHEQIELGNIKPVFHLDAMLRKYFSSIDCPKTASTTSLGLSPDESLVLQCIQKTKISSLEDLLVQLHKSPSELLSTISMLEIKELVTQKSPGIYCVS